MTEGCPAAHGQQLCRKDNIVVFKYDNVGILLPTMNGPLGILILKDASLRRYSAWCPQVSGFGIQFVSLIYQKFPSLLPGVGCLSPGRRRANPNRGTRRPCQHPAPGAGVARTSPRHVPEHRHLVQGQGGGILRGGFALQERSRTAFPAGGRVHDRSGDQYLAPDRKREGPSARRKRAPARGTPGALRFLEHHRSQQPHAAGIRADHPRWCRPTPVC